MKLSVIVPVYKVEAYLRKCVDSILGQTFSDFELILVDDGSPDGCPAICDEYEKKDSRVRAFHKENGGLMSAWKYGVERALGEYIGFVDSDDWVDADMFGKMLEKAETTGADLVCSAFVVEYPSGRAEKEKAVLEEKLYTRREMEELILPRLLCSRDNTGQILSPNRVTKLFRRELLLPLLPECDERVTVGEDLVTSFLYLLKAQSVYVMRGFYPYHYRMSTGSIIRTFSVQKYEKLRIVRSVLLGHAGTEGFDFTNQICTDAFSHFVLLLDDEMVSEKGMSRKELRERWDIEKAGGWLENCDVRMLRRKNRLYLFLLKHRLFGTLLLIRKLKKPSRETS